jgi:mannose-1-phosphate guanylyltransferase
MVQRIYQQLRHEFPQESVIIATGAAQHEQIIAQLGTQVAVVCEPARRDTFPAIALSSAYIADSCKGKPDDVVLVLPVDAYAEQQYFSIVRRMQESIAKGQADLALMGIAPTYPSDRFGYMVPKEPYDGIVPIDRFMEKPDVATAQQLIAQGACWNGGVFAFTLGYLLDRVKDRLGTQSYKQLLSQYADLEKISFDYAVVEQAQRIVMEPYRGMWRDLGTWDALVEEMGSDGIGMQKQAETEHTIIVNELSVPVVALGTKNLVIAANADGILVSDLSSSTQLKPIVDTFKDAPRYLVHPWGFSTVVDRKSGPAGYEVQVVTIALGSTWVIHGEPGIENTVILLSGSIADQHLLMKQGSPLSIDETAQVSLHAQTEVRCLYTKVYR